MLKSSWMSANATWTLKQQSVLLLSLCNVALMDLLLMQLASPLLLLCLSSPLSVLVCACLCVCCVLQGYLCLHGRVSQRTTSGGASIVVSTRRDGRPIWYQPNNPIIILASIWALLGYHRLCYLSINFAVFVPDLGRWRRLNPLGVQEVS